MKKGSRFLRIDWVPGKALEFCPKGSAYIFVGEHYGYAPVVHRRFVALCESTLAIVDYLLGDTKKHEYTLHWLVNDFRLCGSEWGARIDVGGRKFLLRTGCSHEPSAPWARADERNKRGWQSLYYGEKLPAWSYQMKASNIEPVSFIAVLKPASGNEPLTHDEIDDLMEDWEVGSIDRIFA